LNQREQDGLILRRGEGSLGFREGRGGEMGD